MYALAGFLLTLPVRCCWDRVEEDEMVKDIITGTDALVGICIEIMGKEHRRNGV
jgi:hypothetical protein